MVNYNTPWLRNYIIDNNGIELNEQWQEYILELPWIIKEWIGYQKLLYAHLWSIIKKK